MKKLSDMPNISSVIAWKLIQAGVDTPENLINIGAKDAFIKILTVDNTVCSNMLYALEGAIRGIRWHNLPDDVKADLKEFYRGLGLMNNA